MQGPKRLTLAMLTEGWCLRVYIHLVHGVLLVQMMDRLTVRKENVAQEHRLPVVTFDEDTPAYNMSYSAEEVQGFDWEIRTSEWKRLHKNTSKIAVPNHLNLEFVAMVIVVKILLKASELIVKGVKLVETLGEPMVEFNDW